VVLISQSGKSGEIVGLCEAIPKEVPVAAITNDPRSTLARRGSRVFLLHVEEEDAVSTRT
jgi:D-arabinose 5-phosphate isomerase GutQ